VAQGALRSCSRNGAVIQPEQGAMIPYAARMRARVHPPKFGVPQASMRRETKSLGSASLRKTGLSKEAPGDTIRGVAPAASGSIGGNHKR
jgi:hypothetical protein